MHKKSTIEDLLIRSLDREMAPEDTARLQRALETSPRLRGELKKLQRMRQSIAELRMPEDVRFTEKLMSRLGDLRRNTLSGMMASIFPKVAAACVLVLLISLLAIYLSTGTLSLDAIIGIEELTPEDAGIYLSDL